LFAAVALPTGCGGSAKTGNDLAPHTYLNNALELIQINAVYKPKTGWAALRTQATKMAASAKTAADTYPAIEWTIAQLHEAGDLHAVFTTPVAERINQRLGSSAQVTSPPSVSLAAPGIGMVSLPAIGSSPNTPDGRRYSASALASIALLRERQNPCGWIVDLRGDQGGDMYPMLLSVGPILGSGRLIGFSGRSKGSTWVSYRDNSLAGAGESVSAPRQIPDLSPPPAVAVLTGPNTLSAGEAVAIAFRGRAQTRSFGATTAGATDSSGTYPLTDGAAIRFASYWDTDREGHIYRRAITPDVAVSPDWNDRPVRVATAWLRSTPGCSARP
jgi:hypothetical protein